MHAFIYIYAPYMYTYIHTHTSQYLPLLKSSSSVSTDLKDCAYSFILICIHLYHYAHPPARPPTLGTSTPTLIPADCTPLALCMPALGSTSLRPP